MGLKSLRFFNGLFSLFMAAILIVTMLYAGFALWDNHQIYHAAETVFDEMKEIKARMAAQANEEVMQTAAEQTAEMQTGTVQTETVQTVVETVPASSDVNVAAGTAGNAETLAASEADNTQETMTTVDTASGQILVQAQGITGTVEIRNAAEIAAAEASAQQTQAEAEALEAAEETAAAAEEAKLSAYQPYGAPFDELKAINPDVNGWLTMPETAIDYPLVQGETNYSYINTDVYGEFALAGSIFLDSRNDNEYLDVYSLLYGHNMSKHRMFGDVNLYKDQEFFEKNQQGELYLPDRKHTLQAVSCIVCSASDWVRFNPERWKELTNEEIVQYSKDDALYVSETGLNALQTILDAGEKPRLLALSTCSDEFTDARTILLTLIE